MLKKFNNLFWNIITIIVLIVYLTLALIVGVNAELESTSNGFFGIYKVNNCISLKQTCSNCTFNNITSVLYPNSTQAIGQVVMTKIGTEYNYTFCNTSLIGDYIVNGKGNIDGTTTIWSYDFTVTPTGTVINAVQISIYIIFLLLCLVLTYFSIRLFSNNKHSKNVINDSDMYKIKKRNELEFYMELMKQKLWIVGIFGVYLSLLLFTALLSQLLYNIGLTDLNNVLFYLVVGFTWGLIPFTLFWFVWLIFTFYKSLERILRHQFGNFRSER